MAKKSSVGKIAAGVGLAALAAAAAGTYYFYGDGGKKHRQQAKAWTKAAKSEVLKKIKGMQSFSKQAYGEAVSEVLAKYKQAKNIKPEELVALGSELKGHWDGIKKEMEKMGTAKKKLASVKKKVSGKKKKSR